jgi:predicted ABC-type ATPase
VENGGHPVPPDKIASRYPRSLANLAEAVRFVSSVEFFDNSDAENPHRRIAHFEAGALKWKTDETVPRWARPLLDG